MASRPLSSGFTFPRPSPAYMKLGITTKAFLAVLLVALAVLLAMGVAGRWSFTRGFVGYMDELALQRVEDVTPKFVNAYAREGSWDFLRNNRRVWFHLTRPHGGEDDPLRPGDGRGAATCRWTRSPSPISPARSSASA
jgi:two-component system sensor histidine kinase BaeS